MTRCPREAAAGSSRPARRRSTFTPTRRARTAIVAPAVLVRQAFDAGVRLMALTDHDTLAGYRDVRAADAVPAGMTLIPGVEINAIVTRDLGLWEGELHILGFGMDPDDAAFEATLAAQRGRRRERFETTVALLRELDLSIDTQVERLSGTDDDALGRPTVARALIEAGHATSVEDAFGRLLAWGKPAYVPRTGLGPVEAIEAIRDAGGLPVLAHFSEAPARVEVVRELVEAGLGGLEVYYRSFDAATVVAVGEVAASLGIVATGGSDYHGDTEHLCRGARGAVGPARGRDRAGRRWRHGRRRRRLAGTAMTDRSTPTQPRALPMLDFVPPTTVEPRRPAAPADDRLAEYLPEPRSLPRFHVWTLGCQMNRSDSEEMAGRLLAAGCEEADDAREREPRRHQHLRDPRGRRAEGHRPDGPAQPAQGGRSVDARRPDRLLRPRARPGRPAPPLSRGRPVPAPRRGTGAGRPARSGVGAGAHRFARRGRCHDDGRACGRRRRRRAVGHAGSGGRGGDRRPRVRDRRLAADHLRLRQDVHLLHRPVQPRPGAEPAVRRHRRRGRGHWPPPATGK